MNIQYGDESGPPILYTDLQMYTYIRDISWGSLLNKEHFFSYEYLETLEEKVRRLNETKED